MYGDGDRQAFGVAWGTTGERGSVLVGANYNRQDEVSAGERKFARNALYLYNGFVTAGGSSRTPNGRIRFNAGDPLRTLYGCSSVTKLPGVPGDSLDDYRCFNPGIDLYNYQPLNLVMTPQERASVFTSGNFNVTDNTEVYAEWLHGYTSSGYQIAELPFDATQDDTIIPANNVYNPFGIDFGGLGTVNPNAQWRLKSLGTRRNSVNSTTDQLTTGVKGKILDSSWTWDLSGQYAHFDQDVTVSGYLQSSKLQSAFGENFIDGDGNVVCGTPASPIPNCTPVNPFDINNPAQRDALKTITASYKQNYGYTSKTAALDFGGDLFKLPAGAVQAAVGISYNEQNSTFDTDSLTEAQPPDYLNCGLSQETCSGDVKGDFNVKEIYGEIFIPILKDVPAFQALNLTIGSRYSDYNTIGSTTNSSVKLEWRPITDLLLRASYAEVFRAPQINDLYGAKASTSTTYADPCVGLTPAAIAEEPGLAGFCENVPLDGSFEQDNGQVQGLLQGTADLKPETGDVFTAGIVYEPSWFNGFSFNVDYWEYKLDDVITAVDVDTSSDICVANGDPQFCGYFTRGPFGDILAVDQPTINLGTLETSGIDFGVKYLLRDTAAGSFQFTLDATYIDKYDATPCDVCDTIEVAGTYNRQYGNYAEWRGPSKTYVDLTLGYTFWEKLTVTVGVDNLTNEQPPIMYQNNVTNANTDVSTYDTIGTYYRMGVKYKF
jgi:outer membrane receptor protein involved in Fe transport